MRSSRSGRAAPGAESGTIGLPLDAAQRLLWGEPAVEAIELRDPGDPWRLAGRVRRVLGDSAAGLRVEGLEELHRPLLVALALERVMIFVAVGLMLVVAALNLLSNVAMVAAEKRTDLAVLSGLGLPPSSLRRLFVLIGLGIGASGAVLGALLGVAVATALDCHRRAAVAARRVPGVVGSLPVGPPDGVPGRRRSRWSCRPRCLVAPVADGGATRAGGGAPL